MKFPNHIILDISKPSLESSTQYWLLRHFSFFINNKLLFNNFTSHQKYYLRKESTIFNKIIQNQKKFTVRYNLTNPAYFLSEKISKFYTSFFEIRQKVKNYEKYSKHFGKEIHDFSKNSTILFNEKYIKRLINNFKFNSNLDYFKTDNLWTLFDITFIRKEKIYTKLKYSRVPQYDIVSGGVAAIFAGFLGFLICEKFGFELLDSGDFYFLFMYLVFLFFFIRLFFKIMDNGKTSWNVLSLKWLFYFYQIVSILAIKKVFKTFKFTTTK